jgi:hypothetical protein
MICQASLRLSVAVDSLGAAASATQLYACKSIEITPTHITFKPSEKTAKSELLKHVGQHLNIPDVREDSSKPWVGAFAGGPLLADPVVYFRLLGNDDKICIDKVVRCVKTVPTAAWSRLALECASQVESSDVEWSRATAALEGSFNAKRLTNMEIADVLTTVRDCRAELVQDAQGVLSHIKFNAQDMRNALYLLDTPEEGLKLLQGEGGLDPDQVVVGKKLAKLGVDVSQFKELQGDADVNRRIMEHWIKCGVNTPEKALDFFVKPMATRGFPRHPTCYVKGMTPWQFYKAREKAFGQGEERAIRRTQVLGMLLEKLQKA